MLFLCPLKKKSTGVMSGDLENETWGTETSKYDEAVFITGGASVKN